MIRSHETSGPFVPFQREKEGEQRREKKHKMLVEIGALQRFAVSGEGGILAMVGPRQSGYTYSRRRSG